MRPFSTRFLFTSLPLPPRRPSTPSRRTFSTHTGLAALPTSRLLRSTGLLHLCASSLLVSASSRVLKTALAAPAWLNWPLLAAARATLLTHFTGGEQLPHVRGVASWLSRHGIKCIVDHSTEQSEDPSSRQINLHAKLELLQQLRLELPEECGFVPVKLTALVAPSLLEKITRAELTAPSDGPEERASEEGEASYKLRRGLALLDASDREEMTSSLEDLRKLCEAARECSIPLLLDAEQTSRQPAVHLIARVLSAEFNPIGKPPLLYNTHQAYLRGAHAKLREELHAARASGFTLAVKLVRGAYRATEDPGLLQPSKRDTDDEYNACMRLLLDEVAQGSEFSDGSNEQSSGATDPHLLDQGNQGEVSVNRPNLETSGGAALLLATHNRTSVSELASHMEHLGLARNHPYIHVAQILGMADDVTFTLGLEGFNVLKLVPYGEIDDVMPWLLRRLDENHDILGAATEERPLLRSELRRRITNFCTNS